MRVTVIVSHFNRPDGLRRALASVEAQTIARDVETIVCDDATPAYAGGMPWDALDGALVLRGQRFSPEEKARDVLTVGRLINRALAMCTSPLVAYLTDDAEWHDDAHLERLRALILEGGEHTQGAGASTRFVHADPEGVGQYEQKSATLSTADFRARLMQRIVVDHSAMVHRRSAQRGWPEAPKHWPSPAWQAWRRMAEERYETPAHGWILSASCSVTRHITADDFGYLTERGMAPTDIFRRKATA